MPAFGYQPVTSLASYSVMRTLTSVSFNCNFIPSVLEIYERSFQNGLVRPIVQIYPSASLKYLSRLALVPIPPRSSTYPASLSFVRRAARRYILDSSKASLVHRTIARCQPAGGCLVHMLSCVTRQVL
jgi:hypothetical protein